jgi:prepilin-type N-terminal cleavage/methylation domain-containing protein
MRRQQGFTIIELLIATTVFGTLLTIATAGFLGIGNIFYKGVALTQTQNVSSQIINDISSNIQRASTVSTDQYTPGGYHYYCIGGVRYTFLPQHELDTSVAENYSLGASANYGLLKDTLASADSCPTPCVSSCAQPFNKPQEILGDKMRVMTLDVIRNVAVPADPIYTVSIVIAYGDDDTFNNVGNPNTIECTGTLSNQRFCAVNRQTTSVYQGLPGIN